MPSFQSAVYFRQRARERNHECSLQTDISLHPGIPVSDYVPVLDRIDFLGRKYMTIASLCQFFLGTVWYSPRTLDDSLPLIMPLYAILCKQVVVGYTAHGSDDDVPLCHSPPPPVWSNAAQTLVSLAIFLIALNRVVHFNN